jgi:heptosyltransferase II
MTVPLQEQKPVAVIRLSNWIGDVVLMLPALLRLSDVFALRLVGRRWVPDLLAAYGWSCHVYPATVRARVALLRSLRGDAGKTWGLCFPTSLSSALEFRLAGLPALGYAKEGRSPLLRRALPIPRGVHMAEHFAQLADALLQDVGARQPLKAPPADPLRLSAAALVRADQALAQAGITGPFMAVCPLSSDTTGAQGKDWPHFNELVSRVAAWQVPVVACPGPGEEATLAQRCPAVVALPGLGVDAYAGVLARACCVVANDTGPGHLAAALGRPLISVLGPTDPARWAPRGEQVEIVRGWPVWPGVDDVAPRVQHWLAPPQPSRSPLSSRPA